MHLIKLGALIFLALGFACNMASADTRDERYEELVKSLENAAALERPITRPKYSYDITAHSNCVLANSKGTQTPIQSTRISTACRHKATPKKCRDVSAMPPDNESKSPQEICGEECAAAGMWSRKYGECSLD